MTPYRSAPVDITQKAPRTAWWRLLTRYRLARRLDIRRRRLVLRARWPWARWRDCQDAVAKGYEHHPQLEYVLYLRLLAKTPEGLREIVRAMVAPQTPTPTSTTLAK